MAHRIRLNLAHRGHRLESWDPEAALAQALNHREQFLQRYPKYRKMQSEIDQLLDKAGSSENRMVVLAMLIEGKLIELHHHLQKLNGILLRVSSS